MASKGKSQADIARTLQVHEATISNDMDYLREQSKQNIQKYIDSILPLEYEKTLVGLTAILKEMWTESEKADIDTKEKVLALSLAKEIYAMKLDLLNDVSTLEKAMKFIANYKNTTITTTTDIIEEQEEEESTTATATTTTTTNKVF
jgi:predicted transcriptional regulator